MKMVQPSMLVYKGVEAIFETSYHVKICPYKNVVQCEIQLK